MRERIYLCETGENPTQVERLQRIVSHLFVAQNSKSSFFAHPLRYQITAQRDGEINQGGALNAKIAILVPTGYSHPMTLTIVEDGPHAVTSGRNVKGTIRILDRKIWYV